MRLCHGFTHVACTVEDSVRLDDEHLRVYFCLKMSRCTQRKSLFDIYLAVQLALNISVLTGDGTFDEAILANHDFAGALDFALDSTVNMDIVVGYNGANNLTARSQRIELRTAGLGLCCHICIVLYFRIKHFLSIV